MFMKCSERQQERGDGGGKERKDTRLFSIHARSSEVGLAVGIICFRRIRSRLWSPSERYAPVSSEHRGPFVVERLVPPSFSLSLFFVSFKEEKSRKKKARFVKNIRISFSPSLAIIDQKMFVETYLRRRRDVRSASRYFQ